MGTTENCSMWYNGEPPTKPKNKGEECSFVEKGGHSEVVNRETIGGNWEVLRAVAFPLRAVVVR